MSSEVGSGQVAIHPVFKGFRSLVTKEVDGATKDAARGFRTGFQKTGDQTGAAAGKGFRKAFTSNAQGAATAVLKQMTADVAKSAREVSAARLKEQDAAGKVRLAESQLAEARKRYAAGSSQVIRGEERFASVQRTLASAQDLTRVASDRLTGAKKSLAVASEQAGAASQKAGGGIRAAFSGLGSMVSGVAGGISNAFRASMGAIAHVAAQTAQVVGNTFLGIGAAITATLGASLIGGFGRLVAIENAEAKLRALGNSAEDVKTIMTNALAAVKGTSFGLDEAATIAASAVAAGIKPGQQLEKYLKLTADAATIAGVPLSEMGSILNKVTTNQKAYSAELNQLADRGIPIYQWLAEEYGVTAAELRDMVAEGKVDAETYRKVIEENIGGAALSAGDTTTGAWKNVRAAMNRLGAGILGTTMPIFKDLFNTITLGLDFATAAITPFTDKFGEGFVAKVAPALETIRGIMTELSARPEGFSITDVVDEIVAAFPALQPALDLFNVLAPILPVVRDGIAEILPALAPLIPVLAQAVVELLPGLVEIILALLPIIPPLVEMIAGLRPVLSFVADILVRLIEHLNGGIAAFSALFGLLAGDVSVDDFLETARGIPGIWGAAARSAYDFGFAVGKALRTAIGVVRDMINAVIDLINTFSLLPDIAHVGGGLTRVGGGRTGGRIPGQALGGTVTRAGLSWVGELGPEILSLPVGARVTPLEKASTGGGTFVGDLVLDSGEFLGAVRGEIRAAGHQDTLTSRMGRQQI